MPNDTSITGRDDYIIAQALYVGAKALRSQEYPEESNAEDMEALAEAWFPGSFEQRRIHERFQEGLRMGLKMPMGGVTMTSEAVEAWIAAGTAAKSCDDMPDKEIEAFTEQLIEGFGIIIRSIFDASDKDVILAATAALEVVMQASKADSLSKAA